MATYLDRIVAAHRKQAALDDRDLGALEAAAREMPAARGFRAALASVDPVSDGVGVIAEVKRRSPSKGDLLVDLDPRGLAQEYESGGATCLSVLTDADFFAGSVADLQSARSACSIPVLRKDFTVSAHDVLDARIMGADCVLLIAAVLSRSELASFHDLAVSIGLDVLVEIHDEPELEVALDIGASLVGVNQRDLITFEVDHERALRMAGLIPVEAVPIAESGVRGPADASDLADAGYRAVLVGESLVTSGDPRRAVSALRGR